MSVACTRINNEPLSTSLLGNEKETNMLNSIFDKPDGTSLHQIANETHIVSPTVLENWINATQVSLSATSETGRSMRFKHPVVEQLAMTGTRSMILDQDHQKSTNNLQWHGSRAVYGELPRQTGLKSENNRVDDEVQVVPGLRAIWSNPLFYVTQKQQYRPSPRNLDQTRARSLRE